MYIGSVEEQLYNKQMQDKIVMLQKYRELEISKFYRLGKKIHDWSFTNLIIKKKLIGKIKKKIAYFKLKRMVGLSSKYPSVSYIPNYFLNENIAVYTCVFGNYDAISEPLCHSNNIDYYLITDSPITDETRWKIVDITKFEKNLVNLDNVKKNRWFKMHPHIIFPEYRYSIYIDGNVVPITDFTEFVNRIGKAGVAMNRHSYNDCVYKEALFNLLTIKKVSEEEIRKQVEYLRSNGMPKNYGMVTCNVIARDHQNKICQVLMEEWWKEFCSHCSRDQLSFPYVAWKNGISIDDVSTLGSDSWNHHAYYVKSHREV